MHSTPGRGKAWLWGLIGALAALAMACTESAYSTGAAQVPAITSAALQPTVEAAELQRYLAAVEAEETLRRYHAETTATAEARAALAWAITVTADASAAQRTATAQAAAVTATARAWHTTVEAAYAQATATQNASYATATAETLVFQQQATATAAAWSVAATSTVGAAQAQATVLAAAAEQARLAAERERISYPARAYGPWVMLLAALGVLLWGLVRFIRAGELRLRAVPRDERGDAPLLVLQQGGQLLVYDGDRAFGPALVVDAAGQVAQPRLAAPAEQAAVTARDQAVDLAHRGLPGPAATRQPVTPRQAAQLLQPAAAALPPASIQIVPPAQVRPWLRDVEPQALHKALTLEGEVTDAD